MKSFVNLSITDPDNRKSHLRKFLSYLQENVNNEWQFQSEFSKDYARNIFKENDEVACFISPKIENLKAYVWLVLWNKEIKISNITPLKSGNISIDDYNLILNRFKDDILLKYAKEFTLDIFTTAPNNHIQYQIGEETYEKLLNWEVRLKNGMSNYNPSDFSGWAELLITAVENDSKLNSTLFRRWLLEDMEWVDNNEIERLSGDLEYGLDLLRYYVNNR